MPSGARKLDQERQFGVARGGLFFAGRLVEEGVQPGRTLTGLNRKNLGSITDERQMEDSVFLDNPNTQLGCPAVNDGVTCYLFNDLHDRCQSKISRISCHGFPVQRNIENSLPAIDHLVEVVEWQAAESIKSIVELALGEPPESLQR
jgi:hypothetical protein